MVVLSYFFCLFFYRFEQGPRLPGARFIDMNDIATTKELYPKLNPKGLFRMLPPKELFASAMDTFGIQNSDRVSYIFVWLV